MLRNTLVEKIRKETPEEINRQMNFFQSYPIENNIFTLMITKQTFNINTASKHPILLDLTSKAED